MSSFSVYSRNTFTIEDDLGIIVEYDVNSRFLEQFANFVRNQDAESRPFLADIYNALKKGRDVWYNQDHNTIAGLYDEDWTSISIKELNKIGKRGYNAIFHATINSRSHRFCVAILRLKNLRAYIS